MTYSSFLVSEFLVLWRRKQDVFNALLFFVIVVVLFPIGINSSPEFLAPAAAGIVWCATVLAILMAVEGMFKEDYHDGSLEQLVVSGLSLPLLILLKIVAQWLTVVLPLLLMMPLLSEMLYLPSSGFWVLTMTLLVGTPSLFFYWCDWFRFNGIDKTRRHVGDVADIAVLFASDYFFNVSR